MAKLRHDLDRSSLMVLSLFSALAFVGLSVAASQIWFWRRATRQLRRAEGKCEKCGYLLTGLTEPRCPECGTPFEKPA